jgi:glyoxylase-like metal-dependent hydrolase (beta-lactamase superfamily II)
MKEIVSGVYMLCGLLGAGILSTNIYILAKNDITVVDTGYTGRTKQVLNAVRRLGYMPSDVKRIIITHHHPDHVGSLSELRDATGADVIAHPLDVPYIDGRLRQPRTENMGWRSALLELSEKLWRITPVTVTATVDDGDELPGGIRICHTPGHTQGSICIYMESKRLVIAGDLLVNRFGLRLPSRAFTVDMYREAISLQKLAEMEFDIVCFGHGRPLMKNAHASVADFARTVNARFT